jgi:hypothetical protein
MVVLATRKSQNWAGRFLVVHSQPAWLPLQVPWQSVEIDIAAGENDAHAFSLDIDL